MVNYIIRCWEEKEGKVVWTGSVSVHEANPWSVAKAYATAASSDLDFKAALKDRWVALEMDAPMSAFCS